MKIVRVIIALICALLGDILANRLFPYGKDFFDPYMLVIVYFGTISKPVGSIFIGTAAGLVQDTWRELIFGLNGFKKTLAGYLISVFAAIFDVTGLMARVTILAIATLFDSLVEAGLMLLVGRSWDMMLFTSAAVRAIGNCIVGLAIFFIIGKVWRRSYSEETP
ncbi:MAG: hypothetical protein AB1756_01110 [Acidobacteriota bacterium]